MAIYDSVEGYGAKGMDWGNFDAGIRLLLENGFPDLRGERGPNRPEDYGPDHRGGELVEINPDHRCPPGLGGIGLTEVSYDNRELVGAAA